MISAGLKKKKKDGLGVKKGGIQLIPHGPSVEEQAPPDSDSEQNLNWDIKEGLREALLYKIHGKPS